MPKKNDVGRHSTRKALKRSVDEVEEAKCDRSVSSSESEDRAMDSRTHAVPSSFRSRVVPKRSRTTTVAAMVPDAEKPAKEFHLLTIAELKTFLVAAGVQIEGMKRKSEYVAAAELVANKEKDCKKEDAAITILSDDSQNQSTQTVSASANPAVVVISSSDDDEAPVLTVSRSSLVPVGGAAASTSQRTPSNNSGSIRPSAIVSARGEFLFDPVLDANGAEILVDEDYRESNDVLYGRLNIKTVGIQHYRGVIHVQEAVFLIREPRNPYDSNAVRVDNLSRIQIGHIAAKDGEHPATNLK